MPKSPYALKINWKITFTSKLLFSITLISWVLWFLIRGAFGQIFLFLGSFTLIFTIFAFTAEKDERKKVTSQEYEEIYGEKP